ncbi:hypothetical protein BS78_10G101400 [Paspalum vaginatum]|nr:hypothetical protein BS78_10G101400 [Paspalum vaginatum]
MVKAMTATSTTLAMALLCLSAVAQLARAADGDLVAKVCADATSDQAGVDRFRGPGLTRESCESALRSDNRSTAAKHPRDLALVAMDLLLSATTAADAKVNSTLRSAKWGERGTLAFQHCQVDFEALARTVRVCHASVQEYNPSAVAGRGPDDGGNGDGLAPYYYFECMDKLRDAAGDCWKQVYYAEYVNETGAKKMVWKEVVEATRLANLAKAMVEQMVGMFS